MTLKQYLLIMFLATLLCFVALAFVIYNIDPFLDNGTGFSFFYLSVFLFLLGAVSLISFIFHRFFTKNDDPMFKFVQRSFKNALAVSLVLIVLLYLQGKQYLNWWNVGMVIGIVILYLIFKFSNKKTTT